MDLNEAKQKVAEMSSEYQQNVDIEKRMLALHESATKIWQTNDVELQKKRVVNALISVFLIAESLKISDLDELLENRLIELEKENN